MRTDDRPASRPQDAEQSMQLLRQRSTNERQPDYKSNETLGETTVLLKRNLNFPTRRLRFLSACFDVLLSSSQENKTKDCCPRTNIAHIKVAKKSWVSSICSLTIIYSVQYCHKDRFPLLVALTDWLYFYPWEPQCSFSVVVDYWTRIHRSDLPGIVMRMRMREIARLWVSFRYLCAAI